MFFVFSFYGDWALFLLRVVLGAIFIGHGFPKIRNVRSTAQGFEGMGFKPGVLWGPLVAVVEFFGGLALFAGLWTQIIAGLLAIQFLVIMAWKLMRHESFIGGFELDLLILVAAIVLLTYGGGALALDKVFFVGGY